MDFEHLKHIKAALNPTPGPASLPACVCVCVESLSCVEGHLVEVGDLWLSSAYVHQGAGVEGVRNVISTLVLVSTLTLFRATLVITTVELKVTEGLFNRSHNKGLSDTLLTWRGCLPLFRLRLFNKTTAGSCMCCTEHH